MRLPFLFFLLFLIPSLGYSEPTESLKIGTSTYTIQEGCVVEEAEDKTTRKLPCTLLGSPSAIAMTNFNGQLVILNKLGLFAKTEVSGEIKWAKIEGGTTSYAWNRYESIAAVEDVLAAITAKGQLYAYVAPKRGFQFQTVERWPKVPTLRMFSLYDTVDDEGNATVLMQVKGADNFQGFITSESGEVMAVKKSGEAISLESLLKPLREKLPSDQESEALEQMTK